MLPLKYWSGVEQKHFRTYKSCFGLFPGESKLPSVVRSSMHPCPGNLVAIGCVVVYYAQASHAFSPGIKCLHWLDVYMHLL